MPKTKERPEKPPKPKLPTRKPVRPGKGKDKDKDAGGKLKGISVKGDGTGEQPNTASKDGLSVRSDGSGEQPT